MESKHHQLRIRLDRALVNDDELNAFVMDHYPIVAKQFSAGMNRTAKLNLLFEYVNLESLTQVFNEILSIPDGSAVDAADGAPAIRRDSRALAFNALNVDKTTCLADSFDYPIVSALIDDFLFLNMARRYLFPWERGCIQRFTTRVGMTGVGAVSRLSRLGVKTIPEPQIEQIDDLIGTIHGRLLPYIDSVRSVLRM